MNPNSQHQRWALFAYRVYSDGMKRPDFATVKASCARFGRVVFGSASEMAVRHATDEHGRAYWEVKVLSEGHPVHDPQYTEWIHQQWRRFLASGFGATCEVRCHARLAAGDRQNGTPADQLIIMPALSAGEQTWRTRSTTPSKKGCSTNSST